MSRTDEQRSKHNEYMRAYRLTDKHKAYRKNYDKIRYTDNREEVIARASNWNKNNPERSKLNFRRSYETNRDSGKRKEQSQKWIVENLAAHRAYQRAYIAARRAKIKSVQVGEIDYEAIHIKCAGFCNICDKPITDKFEYDHIIPIARGGSHTTENLQLAHVSCNRRKSSKLNFTLKTEN